MAAWFVRHCPKLIVHLWSSSFVRIHSEQCNSDISWLDSAYFTIVDGPIDWCMPLPPTTQKGSSSVHFTIKHKQINLHFYQTMGEKHSKYFIWLFLWNELPQSQSKASCMSSSSAHVFYYPVHIKSYIKSFPEPVMTSNVLPGLHEKRCPVTFGTARLKVDIGWMLLNKKAKLWQQKKK